MSLNGGLKMNYSYKFVNEKPGFEVEKQIIFLVTDDSNGTHTALHTQEILTNQELFTALVANGNDYRVAKINEIEAPVITCNETYDVTDIYKLVSGHLLEHNATTLGEELLASAAAGLSTALKIDVDLVKEILTAAELQYAYEHAEYDANFSVGVDRIDSDFFGTTKRFFDAINAKHDSMFISISNDDNKTLFQEKETDPLFIKLPDNQTLINAIESDTLVELMPKFGEVAIPFSKDSAAYTPFYKEPDSYIPESEYVLIEGDPRNNSLGIQENEQTFYKALDEWCQYCIKQSFGSNIKFDDNSKVILDQNSQKFLTELINTLYIWYWRHNKNVPASISVLETDDEDSNSNSDTVDSKYEYAVRAGEEGSTTYINALISLDEFLDRVSIELGYKVYLDAVIKLARWGTRKCTALVFENYPYTFELGTGSSEDNIGHISDYDLVTIGDDSKSKVIEFMFESTNPIVDKKYLLNNDYKQKLLAAPVGVAFVSTLRRHSDGKELKAPVYISMIDLVTEIYTNNSFVGISVDENGKIHCTANVEKASDITMGKVISYVKSHSGKDLIDPIAISESLQNVYISLGVPGRDQNQFTILENVLSDTELQENIVLSKFNNQNKLMELFDTCQISSYDMAIEFNVANIILPIYLNVSKRVLSGEVKSFEDLLNVFAEEMLKQDYTGESGFLDGSTSKKFSQLVPAALAESYQAKDKVEKVSSFGEVKGENKTETQKEISTNQSSLKDEKEESEKEKVKNQQNQSTGPVIMDRVSVIKNVNDDAVFAKINDSLGNVVGGGAIQVRKVETSKGVSNVTIITLVNLDYLKVLPENKFKYSISAKQLYAQILHSFVAVEMGRSNGVVTYFKDIRTMDYYRTLFKELTDKGLLY